MQDSGDLTQGQDWDLSLLTLELMLFLLRQQPWRRSYVGTSVLVPRGSADDSVPNFPLHTGHPPNTTHGARKQGGPRHCLPTKRTMAPFSPRCGSVAQSAAVPRSPPELGLLTEPVGRIPLEQGPQEALGFRAQKLGHA